MSELRKKWFAESKVTTPVASATNNQMSFPWGINNYEKSKTGSNNEEKQNEAGYSNNPSLHFNFSLSNTWSEQRQDISRLLLKRKLNTTFVALSASQDLTQVIIAGRDALKILRIPDWSIIDENHLRVKTNNRYSICDVKWGNNELSEHRRAVNRICFNPSQGSMLLSASHDGTMKLWDLRDPTLAKFTFEGKSEGVRDAQFNALYQYDIAAAFENGTIQKWDIRKPNVCERKFNAHVGSVLAIDWHSEGRILASGGRDKAIKIWDMSQDIRKARDVIQSMAGITRVQWRPDHPDEIASCAMMSDNRIFVWNLKRPYVSSYFFEEHRDVPTDKCFIQQDIKISCQTLGLLSKSGMGWSVYDNIAFAIDNSNEMSEDQQVFCVNKSSRSLPYSNRRTQRRIPNFEANVLCQQKTGVASLPTFDHKSFSYLAENYKISDPDIWTACEHNSKVAWEAQRFRTAQTWKIVQLLYTKEANDTTKSENTPNENENVDNFIKKSGRPNDLTEPSSDTVIDDVESSDETEDSCDDEPHPKKYSISSNDLPKNTNQVVQLEFKPLVRTSWNKEPMMTRLLDYYSEQEWFATNEHCPTGCGHLCSPKNYRT
ncbi:5101_t:CDS:10 [Diversispora eburnea]|uniref:5101_t:CDS:1 n=1 Tax=Diversispora eburnea TaxID=1213867 RepID=A0A9N8WNN7_9GLOM|nr:5101_t:CDS:10 [Diversispora eburnea]